MSPLLPVTCSPIHFLYQKSFLKVYRKKYSTFNYKFILRIMKFKIKNKEISWLSFNARLLQEANDPTVPLIERIKFLGIFSNNLDEFFRVRVATLKRLDQLDKKNAKLIGGDPREILQQIHNIMLSQQADFDDIYATILRDLERERIFIVNEKRLTGRQQKFVRNYFRDCVRPVLIPLMIDQLDTFPELRDHSIYLAINMIKTGSSKKKRYALIELPTDALPRFVTLPREQKNHFIILLDDVIRFCLPEIFAIFDFDHFEAFTIKLTRDAELEIEDDFSESFIRKMTKSLKQRKAGKPVRFIYDDSIPDHLLDFIKSKLQLDQNNSTIIPGARYHNFKDFINFPHIGRKSLQYAPLKPLPHKEVERYSSMFKIIQKQDILLHYPYQQFDYIIDLLRESAIDPHVTSIYMTLYRVAGKSKIINALLNAAKNGKKVSVVVELQARFDEEANIFWSNALQEGGVRVIHGEPDFKVHAKLILVTRKSRQKKMLYAHIGTGNFHESTARLYSDHSLMTANPQITKEVKKIFNSLENNYQRVSFRHLLVSPFNMRPQITKMIDEEIKNATEGREAYIIVKLNNITDPKIIKKLYQASQAGVKIRLMVRGMFSLIPGVKGLSENIEARGTVDKYLEHTRIFVFCQGGKEKYFLSSADWMPRNIDRRIEATCPIYDPALQQEIRDFLEIHWQDNVKARILNDKLDNQIANADAKKKVRAQDALYKYFQNKLEEKPAAQIDAAASEVTDNDNVVPEIQKSA